MAVELGTAYVSIMPSTKDLAKPLTDAFKNTEAPIEKQTQGLWGKINTGMTGALKVGAVAAGGVVSGALGTALFKGFQRLDTIDQATAKLAGLGHSAETVEQVMTNATASVKGTAFGMGEAATAAAGAMAAGVKPGIELERNLKLVADAATIAGTDMGSMGGIFNKVAASNKVQMDVINQLHDAGVPALQFLAAEMGVTAEEASKMASRGEIDFATFQNAMESGLGGAALESGNTFSGAMDNVMASIGRMGAGLLEGVFPQMKDGLGGLPELLAPIEEKAKVVGAAIGDFTGWLKDNIQVVGTVAAVFGGLVAAFLVAKGVMAAVAAAQLIWNGALLVGKGVMAVATAAQWLWNAALTANPIGLIIAAVAALVGALIWFFTQTELGQEIWANVTQFISEAWANVCQFFMEAGENIASWWNGLWQGIGDFFTGFWDGLVAFFQGALQWVMDLFLTWHPLGIIISNWDAIVQFFVDVWTNITSFIGGAIQAVADVISAVTNWISSTWNNVWTGIKFMFLTIWNNIVTAAVGFVASVQTTFNNVVSFVSSIPSRIIGFFSGIGSSLINSGRALIQGFLDGIMAGFNKAKDFVSDGLANIRNLFPFSPAKEGPFSGRGWVTYAGLSVGETFTESLVKGINSGRGAVVSALAGVQSEFGAVAEGSVALGASLSGGVIGADGYRSRPIEQNNTIHMEERDPRVLARNLGRELKAAMA